MKVCSHCNKINHDSAILCDCGHLLQKEQTDGDRQILKFNLLREIRLYIVICAVSLLFIVIFLIVVGFSRFMLLPFIVFCYGCYYIFTSYNNMNNFKLTRLFRKQNQ